jgi:HTH-like domain
LKYAFINRHRRVWPISVQCRVLEASVAGYHEHFVRAASTDQRRHLSDDALLVHIKAIHAETRGGYGWPRTWKELLARGIRVGKDRVQKLMQLHGIRAKGKRRFKVISGGKVLSSKTKRSGNRVRQALKMAAMSLSHSDSALGAFYRRMSGRMDKPRANTATAHKLARMVYFMLTRGEAYVDQGQQHYEEQQRQRSIAALKRRAAALGFAVMPTQMPA